MALHTASEGISFARELESVSAQYYEELARRFSADAETFDSFAAVNRKNISHIERAYHGVITDAIEGGYAFDIQPEEYGLDAALSDDADLGTAVQKALKNEETIVRYYTDAAEQSKGTMADVPRAFLLVARKRGQRIERLKALAG